MNELIGSQEQKTFFKVKEGNYKITQMNRKEHVVEFEQFKKIVAILNNKDILFVTINDKIVNKNRIEDIEPTNEFTPTQENIKRKEELQRKEKEIEKVDIIEEEKEFKKIQKEYFDKKYGVNKWTKQRNPFDTKDNRYVISSKDMEEVFKLINKENVNNN